MQPMDTIRTLADICTQNTRSGKQAGDLPMEGVHRTARLAQTRPGEDQLCVVDFVHTAYISDNIMISQEIALLEP